MSGFHWSTWAFQRRSDSGVHFASAGTHWSPIFLSPVSVPNPQPGTEAFQSRNPWSRASFSSPGAKELARESPTSITRIGSWSEVSSAAVVGGGAMSRADISTGGAGEPAVLHKSPPATTNTASGVANRMGHPRQAPWRIGCSIK